MITKEASLTGLSPTIVVGMHRSGTSLVSRFLISMDVFMGSTLSGNYESIDFQSLNKNTMEFLGCSWADICMFPTASMFNHLPRKFLDSFQTVLVESVLPAHFISLSQQDHQFNIGDINWGWKDPRNSVLLPLYLSSFPQAKIVFVIRDSRDVALSLIRREEKRFGKTFKYEDAVFFKKLFTYIKLWCDYNQRILETIECYPHINVHIIKYEELIREPFNNISALSNFLGVCLTEKSKLDLLRVDSKRSGKINSVIKKLNKSTDLPVMQQIHKEIRSVKKLVAMPGADHFSDYIDNIQEFNRLVLSKRRLKYIFARLYWSVGGKLIGYE